MDECIAVNIQDMLKAVGEEELQRLLSDFSSPLNKEVEDFVRNKSIDFAQKKLSVTYLVIRKTSDGRILLAGIFTLAHKAVEVTNTNISKTARRKLSSGRDHRNRPRYSRRQVSSHRPDARPPSKKNSLFSLPPLLFFPFLL